MKKKILSMLLAIIVVAQVLIILSVPASAWDWGTDGNYNVNTYNASIVSNGAITLDAQLDHAYLSGTKITHYPDVVPYFRSDKYSSLAGNAKGEFFAYIAADTKGMYIYTQIEDSTIFTTMNTNGNDGDYLNIYLDWVDSHPAPENRTSSWNYSNYRSTYGAITQNVGYLSADYKGNIAAAWGFSSYTNFGPNQNQSAVYKYRLTDTGWACEWFIPWKDQTQINAIAKGETIPCSIGFQVGDDLDVNHTVTPDKQEDVVLRFDQRKEVGLSYYADYSRLSSVKFVKSAEQKTVVCTKSGLADKICADCGEIFEEGIAVDVAAGTPESHVFALTESREVGCTEDGIERLECKYCDAVDETVYPATGHNYEFSRIVGKLICDICYDVRAYGDVNGDGDVTNSDVLAIFRYIYNSSLYPIEYEETADVNSDGEITNSDVLAIFRYIYNPQLYPIVDPLPEVMVDGIDLSRYVIIYPASNSLAEKTLAEELAERIEAKFGLEMEIFADSEGKYDHEILIGETNRAESSSVYSTAFEDDQYTINVGNNKIAIGFDDNKFAADKAVEDLSNMLTVTGKLVSKTDKAVAEKILTSFMFSDVHNNFGMLEPTNNYGDYIVRKNVDTAIDALLSSVGAVDVVLVGGDLISDYHSWNSSGKWPYKYFVEYRKLLVDTFKRLSKDGKVSYVAGNHDYAQGELSTDGPGIGGSYNSFDFYFGDVGMRQDWGELPEEDMFVKVGTKTGEKYLLAYYYEVNGIGFVGLSADHDSIWSAQGSGFDSACLAWLDKKLDEIDPNGDKVIFVNCHYYLDNRTKINSDGSNTYASGSYDKNALIPVFAGHRNLFHIFGHGEVWHSDTTSRYVSHYNNYGKVIDVTGKETESTQIVSYENRSFTSIYGGHFRPDANAYASWFMTDYVYGYAGTNKNDFTHRSTCTPRIAQGLYIEVYEDRVVFTMKNFGDVKGYKTTDLIVPYTVWLYK